MFKTIEQMFHLILDQIICRYYVQMPHAQVWAHFLSTLVLLLPDHHVLNSNVTLEPQLKV